MVIKLNYTLLVVCTAGLLATSVEIPLSWTSPMFPKLQSNDTSINPIGRPITEEEDGWIGSLVTIGAMIGPFPFGFITEKWGRKVGLLSTSIPIIISFFTLAFATEIYLFYLSRILGGISMGAGYALLPMYISEVSEDHNRGKLSQAINIFWSIGNFLSYAVGPFVSVRTFNLMIALIPTAFFILFIILCPESPYYLVQEKKMKKAERSLMKLRSKEEEDVKEELLVIENSLQKEENGKLTDLVTNAGVRRALIICLILIMIQELVGFVAILFYMQLIFEAAGTNLSSNISSLIVSFFILTSSFVNPFFVDRSGRRLLLIVSCTGMFFSLSLLGTYFYLQQSTNVNMAPIFWLPLFSLICYIYAFNFGIASIPWTLTSELFPNNLKNVASSVVSIVCWATSFIVTKFFNDMNNGIGRAGSFWVFAGFSFIGGVFSLLFVPETKGKSFAEIQDMLQKGSVIQLGGGMKKKTALKQRMNYP